MEVDVLCTSETLPSEGAVRRHAAFLSALQHSLLEGLRTPLHGGRPRQLLHACVSAALHRPLQVLRVSPAIPVGDCASCCLCRAHSECSVRWVEAPGRPLLPESLGRTALLHRGCVVAFSSLKVRGQGNHFYFKNSSSKHIKM